MKQKNLILMVVAVGCGLVAAFLTTQINAKPKVEKISVWVAAKDLPVGTIIKKEEFAKLAVKKDLPKDSLPPAFIVNEEELYNKRLGQPVLKDQTFHPGALGKGGLVLPDGYDLITLSTSAAQAGGGFITPGAKVDVLATIRMGKQTKAIPILVDILVMAVNSDAFVPEKGVYPNVSMVSFAATQKQALVLALAKQRGANIELLLRHEGKPLDPNYNIDKMLELMQSNTESNTQHGTEGGRFVPDTGMEPPVTPETPKIEMVKVWVATTKIPAGTEITNELIAKSLKEKEMPREYAIGAYSDLKACVTQGLTLKTDLVVDAWITESNVGPSLKAAPQEPFQAPKVGTVTEAPKVAPRAQKDIAVTTPNGTMIHRIEEIAPGVWRVKGTLTPEEALKNPIPTANAAPEAKNTPEAKNQPEAKK